MNPNDRVLTLFDNLLQLLRQANIEAVTMEADPLVARVMRGLYAGWLRVITTATGAKECVWVPFAPERLKSLNLTAMQFDPDEAFKAILPDLGVPV